MVRIEDLDGPRTVPAAVAGNLDELRWLGLDWDEGPDVGGPHAPYRQSERGEHYLEALARLQAEGRLAEDWLSRRDLREAASAPHGPAGPVYGPDERRRSDALAAARRASGRAPALRARFGPGDGTIEAFDRRHGARRFDLGRDVGDVVVRRSDGLWAYALAVVVDDAAMRITEVVRGDDLLAATGAQVALARALRWVPPVYAHAPLLHDADGARMAKRRGGATLGDLRAGGADPRRVVGALAATLGWVARPRPLTPAEALEACDTTAWPDGPSRWAPELDAWVRGA